MKELKLQVNRKRVDNSINDGGKTDYWEKTSITHHTGILKMKVKFETY